MPWSTKRRGKSIRAARKKAGCERAKTGLRRNAMNATSTLDCRRLQKPRPGAKRRAKHLLRYRLKAPDGTIHVALGDKEFFAAFDAIEKRFGKNTPALLPVELVK